MDTYGRPGGTYGRAGGTYGDLYRENANFEGGTLVTSSDESTLRASGLSESRLASSVVEGR